MLRASASLIAAAFVLAACDGSNVSVSTGGPTIKGSGNFKTETRSVDKFSAVRLTMPADVAIERTGTQSLAVTADDNLLPLLEAEVRDGTLTLTHEKGKGFSSSKMPSFRVTVGELRTIELIGSGTVRASKLGGNTVSLVISGSGTLSAAGEIDGLTIVVSGSGTANAAEVKAKRAKATLSGSGQITVNAVDEVEAILTGSGNVYYLGAPKLIQTATGSGKLQKR